MVTTRSGRAGLSPTPAASPAVASPLNGKEGAKKAGLAANLKSPAQKKVVAKTNGHAVKTWADTHGAGNHSGAWGIEGSAGVALSYAGILLLMFCCPAFAVYMWYSLTHLDGSIVRVIQFVQEEGLTGVYNVWPRPSAEAWTYLAFFGAMQAAFQLLIPGPDFHGPVTPKGNTPVYKSNGVPAYAFTMLAFFLGYRNGFFDPGRVYDLFGEIIAALNYFSLLFCLFLYLKGRYAPSSTDSGTTGSLAYDFYWGMELYPRIGKYFDLKTWTNCRVGMMGWAVLICCYAVKQHQTLGYVSDSLNVSVILMQIYIFKFFWWESGYWTSMDIAHDRAGYYICWGCLVWVPAIYTSPGLFLVNHPVQLGRPLTLAYILAGVLAIYINYDADNQRQMFRATNGSLPVWGKSPRKIVARYTTGDGRQKTSLLLASGWWGLSRHFHYVPEILAAFIWTVPGVTSSALPFFYVFFLTLLLTDRAFRDDARCAAKYGEYWKEYCSIVPYRMVPGIF